MRRSKSNWRWIPLLSAAVLGTLILSGCSGSSSGGMMPPGPMGNTSPVASVVANPTSVPAGDNHMTVVVIDGSGSDDADGDALSYAWTVPNGIFVGGTTASDPLINVTFPGAAPYRVTLVVSDGNGGSDSASVVITLF